MAYRVGQTATNPKTGQQVTFDGQNWVGVAGTAKPSGLGGGSRGAQQDIKYLNDLSTQAQSAAETRRLYQQAREHIKALNPGPGRGRFLESMISEEGGGVMDTIGGVVGMIPRALGAITKKEIDHFQALRSIQSSQVLERQIQQKGTQTEGDAARMLRTEISPSKTWEANLDVLNRGEALARRNQAKAIFYTQFANKYGLHGQTKEGHTADQIWARLAPALTDKLVPDIPDTASGDIRVISKTRVP